MFRATEALSGSVAEWMLQAAALPSPLAETSAEPAPHDRDGRSSNPRCSVVAGETLEDLKHRVRFSKEDKGLLREWMALAAERAGAKRNIIDLNIAV